MRPIELEVAFRAFTLREEPETRIKRARFRRKIQIERWPKPALIFDTETTIDAAQSLLFGSARVCRWNSASCLECLREYLIHADGLERSDPAGYAILRGYVRAHWSERISLLSRADFLKVVFWPACQTRMHIVGFNLPFDLSRLAVGWSPARGKRYRNGFSLRLWELTDKRTGKRRENRFRPRIRIKQIDSKRSLMGLSQPSKGDTLPAQFLDAKTLAFALTNDSHSLESACKAFEVLHSKQKALEHGKITPEYIEYNRRDVLATKELLEELRREFDKHPIALFPSKALSPASMSKSYLKAMGMRPPKDRFARLPSDALAAAMLSYYGGRAECRIRSAIVPVVYVDFLSMYPTVNTLMELWSLLSAQEIKVEDATEEIRELIDNATPEDLFDPAFWKNLRFFAQIVPTADILPIRARYGSGNRAFNIGVNYLTSQIPLWYSGPDALAAKILSGKTPQIIRAFRLAPKGQHAGLKSVKLRGSVEINPSADLFKAIIEERKNLKNRSDLSEAEKKRLDKFLKVKANSGSYGIFAEMNPEELPIKESAKLTVYGLNGPFMAISRKPEDPGEFWFPLIASLITGAARLMLALLEDSIREAGGHYAFCDTDSKGIVATEHGGFVDCPGTPTGKIKALSWREVEAIRDKFSRLNPYARSAVPGSILKIEDVNFDECGQREIFAFAISAKRYALFTLAADGGIKIVGEPSEHGLGHLLNPTDPDSESREWIAEAWTYLILRHLGRDPEPPIWLGRPAISRITASTPEMVRRLNQPRKRVPYERQVKPMNFALAAHAVYAGLPKDVDPEHFQPIAAYESDPRKWTTRTWVDCHSGKKFAITTHRSVQPDVVQVKSYEDVLAEYELHPESKSAGADERNPRKAIGLLGRRHVLVLPEDISYIGKESNRLEEVEADLEHCLEDVLEVYKEPGRKRLAPETLESLKKIPSRELALKLGISERAVRAIRNGHSQPKPGTLKRLKSFTTKSLSAAQKV
jgi:hypothetical protein